MALLFIAVISATFVVVPPASSVLCGAEPRAGIDYSGCNFTGRTFGKTDPITHQVIPVDLSSANFSNAVLISVKFLWGVDLTNANFTNANLSGSTFNKGSILNGSNFQGAILDSSVLQSLKMENVNFYSASIQRTLFGGLFGELVSMKNSIFDSGNLLYSSLEGVDFTGASFRGTLGMSNFHRKSAIWPPECISTGTNSVVCEYPTVTPEPNPEPTTEEPEDIIVSGPSAVRNLKVTAGKGSLRLTFSRPISDNNAYIRGYYAVCTNAGKSIKKYARGVNVRSISVTNLKRKATYRCTVYAYNGLFGDKKSIVKKTL
jgi:hypothetical protein